MKSAFIRRSAYDSAFINRSNPDFNATASIEGRYRIGQWAGRQQASLFFYVTTKAGNVWTARDFMNLALRAGLKDLPVSFSVDVIDRNAISINGDRFSRVPDPK